MPTPETSAAPRNTEEQLVLRRRFLQRLRVTKVPEVRRLLSIETPHELAALRDACFPDGDECMRSMIEQEIDAQNSVIRLTSEAYQREAHAAPHGGGERRPNDCKKTR